VIEPETGLRTGQLAARAGKLAEIDSGIADLEQMRKNLQAVLEARCDSLTNCSCGLATGLPLETP
jgi:hypothetical protein